MNLIKEIKDILKPLQIPTSYLTYEGIEKTYICTYIWNEKGTLYGDDKEVETEYAIQISLFTDDKLKYYNLCEQLKAIMKKHKEKFIKFNVSPDMYDKQSKIFHKAFRYLYYVNENN